MSKIVLPNVASADRLTTINDNFQKVEDALNNNVLYRDNLPGEPNAMSDDLDMNSRRVYNLPVPTLDHEAARLVDVQNAVTGAKTANLVTVTPAGTISSTNVQAALQELDGDVQAHINDTSAAHSSSAIDFIAAGTGAVVRTAQDKLRETMSAFDKMTDDQIADVQAGTALIDVTAAIQNALDSAGAVLLPQGTYRITSTLDMGSPCSELYGEGMYLSVLSKQFNGTALTMTTNGAHCHDFGIAGNGATYTGGGIKPVGYNTKCSMLRIDDTADSPIIYDPAVGSNATAGTYGVVEDCFLKPRDGTTTYAIRSTGTDDSNRPTVRSFSRINGGSSLVDFSGMNFAILSDSLGTLVKFDANCSKIHMTGNRLTVATASISVYGFSHIIDANSWGFGAGTLTIDASCSDVTYGPSNNIVFNSVTTNVSPTIGAAIGSGMTNNIHTRTVSYTPTWFGTTSNAVVGNGSVVGSYSLSGRECVATAKIVRGSTTTPAVGTFSFQLPFKAASDSVGSVYVKSSTGIYYIGTLAVFGNSSVAYIYLNAATSEMTDASVALGTNAVIGFSIAYNIATS